MQLMWSNGPLGRMHCVAVRSRILVLAAGVAAAALVAAGCIASLAALKLAVHYEPALVASLGGVVTAGEAEQRESQYRAKLDALRAELVTVREQLGRLDALKDEVAKTLVPARARAARPETKSTGGRGGPHIGLDGDAAHGAASEATAAGFDSASAEVGELKAALERAHGDWHRALLAVRRTPLVAPLADMGPLTSRFGARADPFTGTPARHDGIDIGAPAGTPFLATASGVVARIAHDPQYGNMVDVDHGNGYVTRYAHALSLRVKAGDRVERGTVLGTVGSTGRSTAPHLHYEVRLDNRPQNPVAYLSRAY